MRLNPCEYLDVCGAAGACIGHDIEAGQQQFAVGAHGQDAAAFSSGSAGLRAIDRLSKVQVQFVGALLQRNCVSKLPLPGSDVEIGVLRAPDLLRGPLQPCLHRTKHRHSTACRMIDKAAA